MPVLFLGTACRDNQLGIDKRIANQPPQTQISAGPRDAAPTFYRVPVSWWGSDPDGAVDHYEFILVDHPKATEVDATNPLEVMVPGLHDPRWIRTNATDTLLVTLADTLLRDPAPDWPETPEDVRQQAFERWHSFFVRAVDNDGAVDATPEYLSFNSRNYAPTIELLRPARNSAILNGTPSIAFTWDGEDVGSPSGRPVASRWVLIESRLNRSNWTSWPDSLYTLPERYEWSPWKDWDAEDGSGTSVVVRNLLRVGERESPPSGYYIFAVQAMDEAGATTVVFDKDTPGKNNSVLIRVTGPPGPRLVVDGGNLGIHQFVGTGNRVRLDLAYQQPMQMRWDADAGQYGGTIAAYRYAWNLINPDDDEGWEQNWASSARSMPVHPARDVLEYFYLETRDTAGLVTSAVFEILGHRVTRNRDVLWVDDTHELSVSEESNEDSRWVEALSQTATEAGFQFSVDQDVWDVTQRNGPPPAELVFNYKVVVWSVRNGWGLSQLGRFVDPFGQGSNPPLFNYLKVYLHNDGNLWINGDQPAKDLWPTARHPDNAGYFVNVTHWDDPVVSHPLIDSAGVSSLMYELGVEMFDIGGATGTKRSKKEQYCLSLQRTTPDGVSAQTFATSSSAAHQHVLSVANAIVDRLGGGSVALRTDVVEAHDHSVELSTAAIAELQAGYSASFTTSTADSPEEHVHDVEVRDEIGRWGAPFLLTGSNWNPVPGIGRINVEIYNMPGAITSATPPIQPPVGRALAVYEYGSGIPANPATGVFYPETADGQPVFVLARKSPTSERFSRALCSFPPAQLHPLSQQWLTEFVLVRHFALGRTP